MEIEAHLSSPSDSLGPRLLVLDSRGLVASRLTQQAIARLVSGDGTEFLQQLAARFPVLDTWLSLLVAPQTGLRSLGLNWRLIEANFAAGAVLAGLLIDSASRDPLFPERLYLDGALTRLESLDLSAERLAPHGPELELEYASACARLFAMHPGLRLTVASLRTALSGVVGRDRRRDRSTLRRLALVAGLVAGGIELEAEPSLQAGEREGLATVFRPWRSILDQRGGAG